MHHHLGGGEQLKGHVPALAEGVVDLQGSLRALQCRDPVPLGGGHRTQVGVADGEKALASELLGDAQLYLVGGLGPREVTGEPRHLAENILKEAVVVRVTDLAHELE
jgi:hypothetical protein